MSNKANADRPTRSPVSGFQHIHTVAGISEYRLRHNGLRILIAPLPQDGVITSNITYHVGSRDEARGETGLAHMLEHMLFKPTVSDRKRGIDSGAMQLERDSGCLINANTWRDRTNYYFSYPAEYFDDVLSIEADRMYNLTLEPEDFLPEQGNVLSEFDMYFGHPEFALSYAMSATAFFSHPYGHEVIGHREDIAGYTVEQLQRFYQAYYRPDNATLTIAGDVTPRHALRAVKQHFGELESPHTPIPRLTITEPAQEGLRHVTVERESGTNLLALGVRHAAFPTPEWYETWLSLAVLCSGPESILQQRLVDTGIASRISFQLEPSRDPNLATVFITLAPGHTHTAVTDLVHQHIAELTVADIRPLVKKQVAHELTEQAFLRTSSLDLVDELAEFVSAGDWPAFTAVAETIAAITPTQVRQRLRTLFTPQHMVTGHFIGNNHSSV